LGRVNKKKGPSGEKGGEREGRALKKGTTKKRQKNGKYNSVGVNRAQKERGVIPEPS